jgi:aspartokinase-like uncharacterized kinase
LIEILRAERLSQTIVTNANQRLRSHTPVVETVIKFGGGILDHAGHFDAALAVIAAGAGERQFAIVPGGGPFADAVRAVDRRFQLPDDAAHWMAVLAMDQYAHLLAARLGCGIVVSDAREITIALEAGRVPVLAPSRWLREADPLPHRWDVTSDSIAAWVAGELGARRLIVIKPPNAGGNDLIDPYFARALPAHVMPVIVTADRLDLLRSAVCAPV